MRDVCKRLRPQLELYAEGELRGSFAVRRVTAHLDRCAACRFWLAEYDALTRRIVGACFQEPAAGASYPERDSFGDAVPSAGDGGLTFGDRDAIAGLPSLSSRWDAVDDACPVDADEPDARRRRLGAILTRLEAEPVIVPAPASREPAMWTTLAAACLLLAAGWLTSRLLDDRAAMVAREHDEAAGGVDLATAAAARSRAPDPSRIRWVRAVEIGRPLEALPSDSGDGSLWLYGPVADLDTARHELTYALEVRPVTERSRPHRLLLVPDEPVDVVVARAARRLRSQASAAPRRVLEVVPEQMHSVFRADRPASSFLDRARRYRVIPVAGAAREAEPAEAAALPEPAFLPLELDDPRSVLRDSLLLVPGPRS